MSFKDKTVVITGGSRGIGRAMVIEFACQGATVFFTSYRHDNEAEALVQEYKVNHFKCSQNNKQEIENTVQSILKQTGSIDILINNAGIKADNYLLMMPDNEWDRVIDTNLNGTYRWVKAVTSSMINARQGVIVNISSVSEFVGVGGQTNYAASKGALGAFTRSLAAELGPRGIRVNAVIPGFIETDMTAAMPRQMKKKYQERILIKRFGKPEEIANVVCYLCSDQASYIYGQEIIVDGGLTSTVSF